MRNFLLAITFIALAALSATSAPRYGGGSPSFGDYLGKATRSSSLGLIDPSRVTFDHSVQMGVVGFGGGSLMQSLYSSTAHYRVSDPVSLSFTLGMMGTRYSGSGAPAMSSDFIGGVALDYRPSNNMHFRIEIAQAPGYYGLNRYSGRNSMFESAESVFPESQTPR